MTTAVETDPTVSPTNTAMEQAVPSWVDAISDPEVLGYIQKKGWSAPADIVQGYRNLEKLVGKEKKSFSLKRTHLDSRELNCLKTANSNGLTATQTAPKWTQFLSPGYNRGYTPRV